jgi:hypothetical protein
MAGNDRAELQELAGWLGHADAGAGDIARIVEESGRGESTYARFEFGLVAFVNCEELQLGNEEVGALPTCHPRWRSVQNDRTLPENEAAGETSCTR